MLEHIYIDNVRSFSNFEMTFGHLNLLLGPNGAGKSNLFEVVRSVRSLIGGDADVRSVFGPETITRWDTRGDQKVEFLFDVAATKYRYLLEIEHDPSRSKRRIKHEALGVFDSRQTWRPLYEAHKDKAQLYRDDGSEGPEVIADWYRSGLSIIQPRGDNKLLTRFKEAIYQIWVASPVPSKMAASSKSEVEVPDYEFSDFSSWYRCMSGERQGDVFELTETLREGVLENFDSFRLARVSDEEKRLQVLFRLGVAGTSEPPPVEYSFEELSDGQKILIALYAMHQFALRSGSTFCLDQPENHLAIPEIQPWLSKVCDAADEGRCQVILITHHPELINLLASDSGYWFDRDESGPTRVSRVAARGTAGLPVSELIARGWLHA